MTQQVDRIAFERVLRRSIVRALEPYGWRGLFREYMIQCTLDQLLEQGLSVGSDGCLEFPTVH